MNDPVQLVTTGDSSTQLIINLAALQTLAAETRPVSVVSILGPARTGKSYLMNRLMGKSSKPVIGFYQKAKSSSMPLLVELKPTVVIKLYCESK